MPSKSFVSKYEFFPKEFANLLSSPKAAFLGDSNFPNSTLKYFKGGRIVLFQSLYKKYSGLSFSEKTDRSIAIKGLEERLVKTFETKGGFGIFDVHLQRSLLWQRESGSSLEPILYPIGRKLPSWSWMAYDGRISYLEAPFKLVDWTDDIMSPFTTESGRKQHWEVGHNGEFKVLRGRARKFDLDRVELLKRVKFDEAKDPVIEDLRCIVIGIEKSEGLSRAAERYILVIKPVPSGLTGQYMRSGVGRVLAEHISKGSNIEVTIQ